MKFKFKISLVNLLIGNLVIIKINTMIIKRRETIGVLGAGIHIWASTTEPLKKYITDYELG